MACTDCHNPHGTFAPSWRMGRSPSLVDQALANEETCIGCHSDKRGPFAFEHPPVRVEGCEMCHAPHGSTNSRLLRRPVVFTLCLECSGEHVLALRLASKRLPQTTQRLNAIVEKPPTRAGQRGAAPRFPSLIQDRSQKVKAGRSQMRNIGQNLLKAGCLQVKATTRVDLRQKVRRTLISCSGQGCHQYNRCIFLGT